VAAAEIAGGAQEPAHLAGLVVVVDAEVAFGLALADVADAVLPLQERVVFLDGQSVVIFEMVLALALAAILALFQLARRIVVALEPALRTDAFLFGRVPARLAGARVLPVGLVFGIALPAARVVIGVGTHGMAIPGKKVRKGRALQKRVHARLPRAHKSAFTRVFHAPQKRAHAQRRSPPGRRDWVPAARRWSWPTFD
jgi:hypothetical protein